MSSLLKFGVNDEYATGIRYSSFVIIMKLLVGGVTLLGAKIGVVTLQVLESGVDLLL